MLIISFYFAVFGVFLSSIILFFIGIDLKIYNLVYVLFIFMGIQILYNYSNYKKNYVVFTSIFLFSFYILFVIFPVTVYNNASEMVLVGLKNHYAPFLIALFILLKINDSQKLNYFLKTFVFCGLLSSLLCIFETINILYNISPSLKSASYLYAYAERNTSTANALDTEAIISFIRPTGLFFYYTQNGFFNASCFIILFLGGKNMFRRRVVNRLILGFLYAGVLFSTSRQVIVSFHLILLTIIFIRRSRFNFSSSSYLRKSKYIAITIFVLIIPILFISLDELLLSNIILNELSIDVVGRSTPSSIIVGDLLNIPKSLANMAFNYPFHFFFGFGFYIGGDAGSGQIAPIIIGKLIHSELHYFYNTLTKYGLIGFLMYWGSFLLMTLLCWKSYRARITIIKYDPNISLLGFILFLFIGLQLIHYAPMGIGTNYVIALAIFIASLSEHQIKKVDSVIVNPGIYEGIKGEKFN